MHLPPHPVERDLIDSPDHANRAAANLFFFLSVLGSPPSSLTPVPCLTLPAFPALIRLALKTYSTEVPSRVLIFLFRWWVGGRGGVKGRFFFFVGPSTRSVRHTVKLYFLDPHELMVR